MGSCTAGAIPKLLRAGDELSKNRLLELLAILTEFKIVEDGAGHNIVKSRVDPYWLGEILEKHSRAIGEIRGVPVVELLARRVVTLFQDRGSSASWLARTAIEENPQNIRRHDVGDALIVALREAATAVVSPVEVAAVVSQLLASESEMVFRVGLHVARVRFDEAAGAIANSIQPNWFTGGGRHELYLLIRDRFQAFPFPLRSQVLRIIGDLPQRETREGDALARSRDERYWLLAMAGSGDPTVAERLVTLNALLGPAPEDQHEGMLIYFESFHGSGPSPYSPTALQRGDRAAVLALLAPEVSVSEGGHTQ